MGYKRNWAGNSTGVREGVFYEYNEDGVFVGATYRVSEIVTVSGGREEGRQIEVKMTAEEAERKAEELMQVARKIRENGFNID